MVLILIGRRIWEPVGSEEFLNVAGVEWWSRSWNPDTGGCIWIDRHNAHDGLG